MKHLFVLILLCSALAGAQPNHDLWDHVLKTYVSEEGQVNYKDLSSNPEPLIAYLNELVKHQPSEDWSRSETLAYWINAYNAYTIKLILDNYPLESINDLQNPWTQNFIPYDYRLISLNDVEHQILRKMDEPRIHFAIVCASISCPKLQNEAFTAEHLEEQLTLSTKEFLSDHTKNTFETDKAEISKIFKWFSKDFKDHGGVIEFIKVYKDIALSKNSQVSYKTYNWGLNE